tara:strand:- start:1576 stop:4329 length:2754 start_codon:yes stop_codon:yes gene_type:complete
MGCLKPSELWKESNKVLARWKGSKAIEAWGVKDDLAIFKSIFESSTGKIFEVGERITQKDMNKFTMGIDRFEKALTDPGALSNYFVKELYIGAAISRKIPQLKRFFDTLVRGNNYRNNQTHKMMNHQSTMLLNLKKGILEAQGIDSSVLGESNTSGSNPIGAVISPQKGVNLRKAEAVFEKLNDKEKAYYSKLQTEGASGSMRELAAITDFLAKGEGAVFEDFVNVVTSAKKNDKGIMIYDTTALKKKYETTPFEGNQTQYFNSIKNAAAAWGEASGFAKTELIQSVTNLNDIVELKFGSQKVSGKSQRIIEANNEIIKSLEEFDGGYIPHYVLDILGHYGKMQEALIKVQPGNVTQLNKAVNEFVANTEQIKLGLIDRLKAPSKEYSEYFSRNPLLYTEKYISDVASFNHRTYIDKAYGQGLKDLSKVMLNGDGKSDYAQAAEVYKGILNDLYTRSTGKDRIEGSPAVKNIARFVTALQFTSKLGFSTRGALRNLHQSTLNFAYFGHTQWKDSNAAYKQNKEYKELVDNSLAEHGIEFLSAEAATEGVITAVDMAGYGIDYKGGGEFTIKDRETIVENLTTKGMKVAEASAVFTKWAENVNRRSTFKIAFHQRYNQLAKLDKYAGMTFSDPLSKEVTKRSGEYASRVTGLLHFEYSRFGKSKALTGPVGQIAGQFQHYAMSMLDLNVNIVRDYGRAVYAGDPLGAEGGRLVRMAMLHSLGAGLSGLFDVNYVSYLNNDTVDKAVNLYKLLLGDDDEQMEAFYGKGLAGAVGLVPVSDLVDIINYGAAAGYWELLADPESTAGWLMGMRHQTSRWEPGKQMSGKEFAVRATSGKVMPLEFERFYKSLKHMGQFNVTGLTAAFRNEFGAYPGEVYGMSTSVMNKEMKEIMGLMKQTTGNPFKLSKKQRKTAISSLARF